MHLFSYSEFTMLWTRVTVSIAFAMASTAAAATCWDAAARRYDVPAELLQAIARQESGLKPGAVGRNPNGTRDLGLMQINDAWLPTLARFGIAESHLFDACINVHVGAWILADNIRRHGYGWEAVGAYNVGCRQLAPDECARRRGRYITRIARQLKAPNATAPVAAASAPPRIATVSLDDESPEGALP